MSALNAPVYKRPRLSVSASVPMSESPAKAPKHPQNVTSPPQTSVTSVHNHIEFHPCFTVSCFEEAQNGRLSTSFIPLYAHSFFPDEVLPGWASCQISVFYIPDTIDAFIRIRGCLYSSSGVVMPILTYPPDLEEGTKNPPNKKRLRRMYSSTPGECASADTAVIHDTTTEFDAACEVILQSLQKIPFPGGFCKTAEEFKEKLDHVYRKAFVLPGFPYASLSIQPKCLEPAMQCNPMFQPDEIIVQQIAFFTKDDSISKLHRRVEWLLHFFIEACSSIEYDTRWRVLLAYANVSLQPPHNTATTNGGDSTSDGYVLVGFASIYNFFALPLCRRRVSQFFVFPFMQGSGLGSKLLERICLFAIEDENISELTVEDPAAAYRQLRNFVSLKIAIDRNVIAPKLLYPPKRVTSKTSSGNAWRIRISDEMYKKLRKELKESSLQAEQIKEIVQLAGLLPHPLPSPPNLIFLSLDEETVADCAPALLDGTDDYTGRMVAAGGGVLEAHERSTNIMSRDWRPANKNMDKPTDSRSMNRSGKCMKEKTMYQEYSIPMDSDGPGRVEPFSSSRLLKDYRVTVKKRLRIDNLDSLSDLTPSRARAEIEILWQHHYASCYRTIRKLRSLYPRE